MTEGEELAWLAGLLEGEGCFSQAQKRKKSSVLVYLGMCDEDAVERAASIIRRIAPGESKVMRVVKPRPADSDQFRIRIHGRRAVTVMRAVRPLMCERRGARIDQLLEIHS